jgi:hypothetical protein
MLAAAVIVLLISLVISSLTGLDYRSVVFGAAGVAAASVLLRAVFATARRGGTFHRRSI